MRRDGPASPIEAGFGRFLAQNKEGMEADVDFAQLAGDNEPEPVEQEPEYEKRGREDELTRFDPAKVESGKHAGVVARPRPW